MSGKGPDSSAARGRIGQVGPPPRGASANSEVFRAAIRVRPAASRTAVGGTSGSGPVHPGGSELPPLQVAVSARAVDGAATAAAERAVAAALGLRPRQVRVVRGFTSRDKLVEITDPDPDLPERWLALLQGPS